MDGYHQQLKALAQQNGWGEQHPLFLSFKEMCDAVRLLNIAFRMLKFRDVALNEPRALFREAQQYRAELEELVREAEPILQEHKGEIVELHRQIVDAARTIVQGYPKDLLR